jgi:ADP-ribose pyrophosphatase
MERVYMNRRLGEQRIHVEIDEDEIAGILRDFEASPKLAAATRAFVEILQVADGAFSGGCRRDAPEAGPC